MPRHQLPTPQLARPLAPIDPHRRPTAYHRMLSVLYHAEAAAMEGFALLTNPAYVARCDLFDKASRRLIEDEQKHLDDIVALVQALGYDTVLPPSAAEAEFWVAWRAGDRFALPYKPSVAALFCLLSEGLGYALLHHLAELTTDPDFKARLRQNVVDEQVHLHLSLSVLGRALAAAPTALLPDVIVYGFGYALAARLALREQRALLDGLGLDFDVVVGSAVRFVVELLMLAVKDAGLYDARWQVLERAGHTLGERPALVRALHWSMFLPEPPLGRRLVYGWTRWSPRLLPAP